MVTLKKVKKVTLEGNFTKVTLHAVAAVQQVHSAADLRAAPTAAGHSSHQLTPVWQTAEMGIFVNQNCNPRDLDA